MPIFPAITLSRAELDNAAFWDQAVCLDCGAVIPPEELPDDLAEAACPECGSDAVFSAKFVQRAYAFVRELEE